MNIPLSQRPSALSTPRPGTGRRRLTSALVVAASLFALGEQGSAAELTVGPVSLPLTNIPWPAGTQVQLPQFDPTNGPLEAIRISLRGRGRTFGNAINSSDVDQTVSINVTATIEARVGDRRVAQVRASGSSATFNVEALSTSPTPTANSTETAVTNLVNDLEAFIGLGLVTFRLTEQVVSRVEGSTRVRYTATRTSAAVDVTLTYIYATGRRRPEFVGLDRLSDGQSLRITVAAPAGEMCRLLSNASLRQPVNLWPVVSEQMVPATGRAEFVVPSLSAELYFRAVIP